MKLIGILPAAGNASRLSPFRYPKELLPIVFVPDLKEGRVRPVLAAEYSLRAMRQAGVRLCLVIIADWKTEVMRYLGNGYEFGLNLAYIKQNEPRGLADAVNLAKEWVEDSYVCLALPDTVFYPSNAIDLIRGEIVEHAADLVLGVFPTDEPQHLGPVRIMPDGSVAEVLDKPEQIDIYNTWGIAIWSPRFTHFLYENLRDNVTGKPIGEVFNQAVRNKLKVRALFFRDGNYWDIGKADGIGALILRQEVVS